MKNAAHLAFKICSFCWIAAVLFSCKETRILKQTEVENSAQLKDQIMQELVNRLNPKDTVFVAAKRVLGVCGNDERFDSITTPAEKLEELEYIRKHPYFVDINKDYRETYKFGNKILVTGEVFDERFSSKNSNFDNAQLAKKKIILDIQYLDVKKDTVQVRAFDYKNAKKADIQMTFVLKNSNWKPL